MPRRSALYLVLGVPIALLLAHAPLLSYVGWFLTALVHEMGHTVSALFFGSSAVPAIRLDGHAAACHGRQAVWVAVLIWAGLGYLAWRLRERRGWSIALVVAAALYPLFAFTGLKEYLHLAAGHLGELAFATVFFSRALAGGFTGREEERPLYAGLGWLWMGGNVFLFGALIFSESTRQWYLTNGSFGLQNDFVRMAARLGTSLPVVALPMLLSSLAPLPLAWLTYRCRGEMGVSPGEPAF